MIFLKTKFYPVDVERRVILDTPKAREVDCSFPDGRFSGYIGIKGSRLNEFACYRAYEVRKPGRASA